MLGINLEECRRICKTYLLFKYEEATVRNAVFRKVITFKGLSG
jgi:hypothetical protein